MNVIDLVVCAVLIYAVIKGWSSGILIQITGIVGLVLGIYVASAFSDKIAEFLHMEDASHTLTYIITLILVMIAVYVVLRITDKFLKHIGLSLPLRILGVIFSSCKWLLIFCLILSVYTAIIDTIGLKPAKILEDSFFYKPFKSINEMIEPHVSKIKDKIPQQKSDIINNSEEVEEKSDTIIYNEI